MSRQRRGSGPCCFLSPMTSPRAARKEEWQVCLIHLSVPAVTAATGGKIQGLSVAQRSPALYFFIEHISSIFSLPLPLPLSLFYTVTRKVIV